MWTARTWLATRAGAAVTAAAAAVKTDVKAESANAPTTDHDYTADAEIAETWSPLPPPTTYKLKMAVVVHRHGDRTPIQERLGNNFHWENARPFWEERLLGGHTIAEMQKHHPWIRPLDMGTDNDNGRGQLTEKGAQQLHNLGEALRERYVHEAGLLPRFLNPADLTVRSTPVPRCYQSAAALLLGLYPANRRTRSGGRLPIFSRDGATETMWSGEHMCPAQEYINEFWKSHFGSVHYREGSEFKEVVDTVLHAFGHTDVPNPATVTLLDYGEIVNCFLTHKSDIPNVNLPPGFGKVFDHWRDQQWFHKYRNSHAPELGAGRLLREIASQLSTAVDTHSTGVAPYKFAQYSCHDTSLIPLMFTLGLMPDTGSWPKYGSFLILELFSVDRDDDGEADFYVQALYNGHAVMMEGQTEALLPWKDFLALVERRGLTGWKWSKQCKEGTTQAA
eukprot:m.91628 g.91628  ORF g.91628 m.91628 type:complete len:449 (-) comp9914_c0_seq1:75-1421(-)